MTLRACCSAEVNLTEGERAVLLDPAESQRARLLCELQAGHAGPHCALGDNDDQTEQRAAIS
ncbi:hypothetical protein NE236_26285 [Actinoallomurus purpureus]|uniref:hypothetical protein n=1 Tax=Actinoallomurus purpureus TaxID=478114 RepID=UPI002093A3B8|nr:hypothetical protein [Actinoallomurus purpureus]MCO6008490.1 hypothetical protein [Actinoallomurus purpureus]